MQVAILFKGSGSLWIYDWPTTSLTALLTGFMGCLSAASACPELPHLVAAGSSECHCCLPLFGLGCTQFASACA